MIPDESIAEHRSRQSDGDLVVKTESISSWDEFIEEVLDTYPEYNSIYTSVEPLSTGHRIHYSKKNTRVFSKKVFGESRETPMTGEFKHCEMCDITNSEGVIHTASCGSRDAKKVETNYASEYRTVRTNSKVFGKKLNFIICPTWTRYYSNHMLILPSVHINTHALAYNYTLFRALIKTMDLIQEKSSRQLNFVFNSAIGSDPGHLHLHITDQPISYVEQDTSQRSSVYDDDFIKYSCIVGKKSNYPRLIKELSLVYDQQVASLAEKKNADYKMGLVFQIRDDICKIFITIGKKFFGQNTIVLHHTALVFSDGIASLPDIERTLLSEPEPYILQFPDTRVVDDNFLEEYSMKHPHIYVLDIIRSLYEKNIEKVCRLASETTLLEYVYSIVSECQDLERECDGEDLYTYLLNILTEEDPSGARYCKNSLRLEAALVNRNMAYYNKLFKDNTAIYLDGAIASKLFGDLNSALITLARPDTIYQLENTSIGEASGFGVIRPASIRDNMNYPVVIKFQRRKADDQSLRLFENSYRIGLVLNRLREKVPNFMLTLGKVDCLSDTPVGRRLAEKICFKRGEATTSVIMEKISNGISLNEYFKDIFFYTRDVEGEGYYRVIRESTYCFYTIIYQIILALTYAHKKLSYCHNDFHPGNIMVVNTPLALHEYVIDGAEYELMADAISIIIDYDSNYIDGSPDLDLDWPIYNYENCKSGLAIYNDLFMFLTTSIWYYFDHTTTNGVVPMVETEGVRDLFELYMKMFRDLYKPGTNFESLAAGRQRLDQQRTSQNWNYLDAAEVRRVFRIPLDTILKRLKTIYQTRYESYTSELKTTLEYRWGDVVEPGCDVPEQLLTLSDSELHNLTQMYGPNLNDSSQR